MQVTKQQILTGVANYIRSDIIPRVPDKGFKIVLETLATMAPTNPKIGEMIFSDPRVAVVLVEKDGFYDLDFAECALSAAAEAHGGIPLTIPKIPMFTKDEKELTFLANDIRVLKRSIEGQVITT